MCISAGKKNELHAEAAPEAWLRQIRDCDVSSLVRSSYHCGYVTAAVQLTTRAATSQGT